MKKRYWFIIVILLILLIFIVIPKKPKEYPEINRYERIPPDAVKMTPETDDSPPILHSAEFEEPVPLTLISSKGAEDSPFIPIDRNEFYFVFIKDVREDVQVQVRDPANGIWMSKINEEGSMTEPELVWLQDPDMLSLNGCEFVEGNELLFCAAREGYTGLHWFSAEWKNEKWNFKDIVEFPESYEVGELHIHKDELYFHSSRPGGKGGTDIWMSKRVNGEWQEPINIESVNTADNDGYPYISPDGEELWINRFYQGSPSVWRSKKIDNEWQEPELIISQFAGEPTLDSKGNLYFVHHFYKNGKMVEADIYVAYKKSS